MFHVYYVHLQAIPIPISIPTTIMHPFNISHKQHRSFRSSHRIASNEEKKRNYECNAIICMYVYAFRGILHSLFMHIQPWES